MKHVSPSLSRRGLLAAGAITAAGALSGCVGGENGSDDGSDHGNGDISAVNGSFFMLYDLARNVAGEQLTVEDLVPVGSHGDDWEPSPGIIEEVADADAFVYIEGFRGWSDRVASELPEDFPEVVVIDAAEGIDYIEGEAGRDYDPHFWLDPTLAQEAVENIGTGFAEADPDHADIYEDNTAEFNDRLQDVHEQFEHAMEYRTKDIIVIGSHDSYQYWTDRYDLEIHSPVGISPDGEPTAREMQEITDIVEENDLGYILYDMYEARDYAESLQAETDTELLPLSPIEATTEEQLEAGMGYVEHMLEINLDTLEQALEVAYPE